METDLDNYAKRLLEAAKINKKISLVHQDENEEPGFAKRLEDGSYKIFVPYHMQSNELLMRSSVRSAIGWIYMAEKLPKVFNMAQKISNYTNQVGYSNVIFAGLGFLAISITGMAMRDDEHDAFYPWLGLLGLGTLGAIYLEDKLSEYYGNKIQKSYRKTVNNNRSEK